MKKMKDKLDKLNSRRILIRDIFDKNIKEIEIAGWVHNTRELGKIKFLILRDLSGIIQITATKGKTKDEIFDSITKISRESVIYIKGKVKASKQAPGGKEIVPSEMITINKAEKLPIDVSEFSKTELPKRLDYRFLDLHRKRIQSIFKIQSTISMTFREHFIKKGFIEFQPPSVISSSSEGGTELFKVKYFEKNAFLAQSPQLYKQMVACSMEKAMTITPVWRAEKHNTVRHLNECRQMDIEMAFAKTMDIMKQIEEVVKDIVKNVLEKNKKELEVLGVKNLKIPKAKYMTFAEIADLMKKHKVKIEEDDLSQEAERKLDEIFPETIVFVYDWPLSGKPFYIMPKDENPNAELSEGFDAIYRGMEISSGGQRIHLPELLIKRLKAKGLNPNNFKSYIDSFRYGAPFHGGWSIGLERFTQVLLGLENIREGTMFPRDRDRLIP
ncbi:aspartate--tRNA(Asn) ligase [Candidatus Pacearchaeota archaeon]|nr:MAG: aspartate--tRNA(Asn) ligase [Candidatus Pacearchaeota archaeon]